MIRILGCIFPGLLSTCGDPGVMATFTMRPSLVVGWRRANFRRHGKLDENLSGRRQWSERLATYEVFRFAKTTHQAVGRQAPQFTDGDGGQHIGRVANTLAGPRHPTSVVTPARRPTSCAFEGNRRERRCRHKAREGDRADPCGSQDHPDPDN